MRRLLSTMRADVRLQLRNGFYYAAALVIVIWVVILRQFPQLNFSLLLPAIVFSNLTIGTYYFFGGLVLLEKGEGTLEAQVVTPLRTGEYLASKVITLTGLAVVESLLIVGLAVGFDFALVTFVVGVSLAAAVYALLGFVAVAPYDSINQYLFPSFFYTLVLSIPLLPYFGVVNGALFYLHPLQGSLVVIQAAFQPVAGWALVYGLAFSALCIGLAFAASRHVFHRFMIARDGVS